MTGTVQSRCHVFFRFKHFEKRVAYDNHPPLADHLEATGKKSGQEEMKSFHTTFPRSKAFFMLGTMPVSYCGPCFANRATDSQCVSANHGL